MTKKKPEKESPDQPSFEEALKRLEGIVRLLEEGEIGLDEALKRYEEGVKLLRQSYNLLQRAERRIELLSGVDAQGNPISQPFEDRATLPRDEEAPRPAAPGDAPGGGRETPEVGDNEMDAPQGLF